MGFIAGFFCAVYFRKEPILFGINKIEAEVMDNENDSINSTGTIDINYRYEYKAKDKNNS